MDVITIHTMQLEQPKSTDILDATIRERYVNSSRNAYTHHYVAKDDGNEIGFLSLDLSPLDEPLAVYEIFVPRHLRRGGFGTRLLRAAEDFAFEHGYSWILVIPRTMDEAFPQATLEA